MAQQQPIDPKVTRRKRFKVFGAVLLVAGLATAGYEALTWNQEHTDDAFIDGNIVQVSPQVGGKVVAVHFTDNQVVKEGDLLVEIDPRDTKAALASAQANLDAALANRQAADAALALTRVTSGADVTRYEQAVTQARQNVATARAQAEAARADSIRAEADVARYKELFATANASRQKLEQATAEARVTQARFRAAQTAVAAAEAQVGQAEAQLKSASTAAQQVAVKEAQLAQAEAGVEQAQAAVETARLNLSYTRIIAPQAGRVAKKAVNPGDVVQKDQLLTRLVAGTPYVTANFKETQLTRMRPGQPAEVKVDAYPGLTLKGHVDSVQPGTGSRFSLLPPENATGNFVKVVQRVPVKIVIDDADAAGRLLAPGMSAVPVVDTGK